MFCKNCGKEIADYAIYCSECGCSQYDEHKEINEDRALYRVMARVALGLGIGSFAGLLYYTLGVIFAVPAIVFAAIGMKGSLRGKAITGLVFAIVSLAIFTLFWGIIFSL